MTALVCSYGSVLGNTRRRIQMGETKESRAGCEDDTGADQARHCRA